MKPKRLFSIVEAFGKDALSGGLKQLTLGWVTPGLVWAKRTKSKTMMMTRLMMTKILNKRPPGITTRSDLTKEGENGDEVTWVGGGRESGRRCGGVGGNGGCLL